jgi:uncharacterized membrane protein
MSALVILLACILFVVCAVMMGVRVVVGTVKLLYRVAPIVVFLGLTAVALLYVDHCAGGKNAGVTEQSQVKDGSSTNGE